MLTNHYLSISDYRNLKSINKTWTWSESAKTIYLDSNKSTLDDFMSVIVGRPIKGGPLSVEFNNELGMKGWEMVSVNSFYEEFYLDVSREPLVNQGHEIWFKRMIQ